MLTESSENGHKTHFRKFCFYTLTFYSPKTSMSIEISKREDDKFVYYDIKLAGLDGSSVKTKVENGRFALPRLSFLALEPVSKNCFDLSSSISA